MSLQTALEKITAQQPEQRDAVWMVGEQLKDILRAEPHLAELVEQDLEGEEMALAACEEKIRAFANKHRTGNFACVIPSEAERIIREFYGLPAAGEAPPEPVPAPEADNVLRLEDFF